ncbi:hypothetical protein HYALB_00002455 [Hymenoscyphus albidus]|uniref:Uncharacterized protein n=2 Tax=Hymenoscyphus TaxID=5182 RepID=A0A9N9PSG5_9HELO|nr:hypothetical protein HYFRA_00000339 [Hymenoscyphus fraxineus]CAG8979331.1 hypothetical protein HYALB_00002455 [Hymenoscyphus albidus]
MSSTTQTQYTNQQQYYLITNVTSTYHQQQTSREEFDLKSSNTSWKLPYTIDDEDLTFDGKPLNMLYEENRMKAERRDERKPSRGRSRNAKK